MNIVKATIEDSEIIAYVISEANRDVAQKFNLNIDNCPKHPSFCTKDWVIEDFEKAQEYFLYKIDGAVVGCVAFENPKKDVAYLNRLSTIPAFRKQGIGEELVNFIFDYSKEKNIKRLSIGIIAKHNLLKKWYLKLGFEEANIKTFSYLPFEVLYMNKFF